jgi:hypothetical protein
MRTPRVTVRRDRLRGRARWLAVPGIAVAVVLVACQGPNQTRSLSVTMDCELNRTGQMPASFTRTVQVELEAPTWAQTGRAARLGHLTVEGFAGDIGTPVVKVYAQVAVSGMAAPDFEAFTGIHPDSTDDAATVDLGAAAVDLTGPTGDVATIDLTEVAYIDVTHAPFGFPDGITTCTPQAGQPTRLADIELRAPSSG